MKKYFLLFAIICTALLVGCGSDEPDASGGEITPDKNYPDPEETITVSLYKNSNVNIDGIFIDNADKFTSNNGWFFTSLGSMKGLGNITLIPWENWATTVPAKKGNGYVAYHSNYGFYRLFISNNASDEMGTITGYQVKYQKPFYGADQSVTFDNVNISTPYSGGTFDVTFTNKSLVPITVESDCDWIEVRHISYGFLPSLGRGIEFVVNGTTSLSPSVGHISVKTHFDKETIITVNREALVPWTATTSIIDLKHKYWLDAENYATLIDRSTIIRGKIVSSDEAGNVFKSITIEDETAAISIIVNVYNLYTRFPMGQDVAFELKDMYIGKYNGLLQIGSYTPYNDYESITYAPLESLICQIIGEPSKVTPITTTISTLHNALFNESEQMKWQSRYITLNDVSFNEPNVPLASYQTSTSRLIHDASGLQIEVRTSGYCNFYRQLTPAGIGSISGILSYHKGGWQLILNDYSDIGNFTQN